MIRRGAYAGCKDGGLEAGGRELANDKYMRGESKCIYSPKILKGNYGNTTQVTTLKHMATGDSVLQPTQTSALPKELLYTSIQSHILFVGNALKHQLTASPSEATC